MSSGETKPQFTICIPTFNRGAKALHHVQTLLPNMDDEWELLVLDNASTQKMEMYQQISAIAKADSRLSYLRHEQNYGFHGNFLACFEKARADHIMIVSDEDLANTEMIRQILPTLLANESLAILRGSMVPLAGEEPRNAHVREQAYFSAGEEALLNSTMKNYYISGAVYNRALLQKKGLVKRLRDGHGTHNIYPHLYLDMLTAAVCDVAATPAICCFEGASEFTQNSAELHATQGPGPTDALDYVMPYAFGSRLDQLVLFRDAANEAVALRGEPFDIKLFIKLYLRICERYYLLVTSINNPLYSHHRIHPTFLKQSLFQMCLATIGMQPGIEPYFNAVHGLLEKIFENKKD